MTSLITSDHYQYYPREITMNLTQNFQISTFKRIEEHLNSQELEKAKQKARILIENDSSNVYARTIELWLNEIDYVRQHARIDIIQKHICTKQIAEALAQLCRMVIVVLKYDTCVKKEMTDCKLIHPFLECA
jgi:hypothetical protein